MPKAGFQLRELASAIGGEVIGDADFTVCGVRTLERASATDLSFVTRASYLAEAEACQAGALLVPAEVVTPDLSATRPLLVADDPSWALTRIIELFHPAEAPPPGVHETAVVGLDCAIDPTAHVGPYAVIGDGCRIEAGAVISAHVVLGRGCHIAAEAILHPHVVVYERTDVGARAVVHAGVVLGADGFGYAMRDGEHVKVPQVGRTVIEEDVEIGALSAIDRALLEETRVGRGTKIDNLVQVGHNVQIGRSCLLCGQVGVAGSAQLGDYVVLGGQSGVADHVEVARGVQAAGKSAVLQSVSEPGLKVGGIPAGDLRRWRRQVAGLERLTQLAGRVRKLEKRLARLDAEAEGD
ncbi:MAG: UDP-3-O-(3-hydroxymyristoyl)glucosamine N-acyltransferase [Acidobacteriota bacterium]